MLILGDFKDIRRNALTISIITILVLSFSQNIDDISILGIIHIKSISEQKFLLFLLGFNVYSLWRYIQYLYQSKPRFDYKILFTDLVKNIEKGKISGYITHPNDDSNSNLRLVIFDSFILYKVDEQTNHLHSRIDLSKENYFVKNNDGSLQLYNEREKGDYGESYKIDYKKQKGTKGKLNLLILKGIFFFKNTYILDVIFPLILFIFSISMLLYKIYI